MTILKEYEERFAPAALHRLRNPARVTVGQSADTDHTLLSVRLTVVITVSMRPVVLYLDLSRVCG